MTKLIYCVGIRLSVVLRTHSAPEINKAVFSCCSARSKTDFSTILRRLGKVKTERLKDGVISAMPTTKV